MQLFRVYYEICYFALCCSNGRSSLQMRSFRGGGYIFTSPHFEGLVVPLL